MIKEIDVSELASYLARKSGKDIYACSYSELRAIGDFLEENDSSIRVSLSDVSYHSFQRCSMSYITVKDDDELIIQGLNTPIMQSLVAQYAPEGEVAILIDKAIEKYNIK